MKADYYRYLAEFTTGEKNIEVANNSMNSYKQANELAEQRVDATNKAKLICIELKKIQDGKWKEVNEFKLPDPVTPEYIYGYKKEERNERLEKLRNENFMLKKMIEKNL